MLNGLNELLAATVLFVGAHFLLSSLQLRGTLVQRYGEGRFRGLYSLVVAVAFVWMVFAYGGAPYLELWPVTPGLRWVPLIVMPFAFILVVAGITTRSPTLAGFESAAGDELNPAPGILRVTRHPFLWGTALWAASHLLVRGDAASAILMGGILVLSLGGMWHIDHRREATLGAAWGPIKLTTSTLPFAALLSGRTEMDWAGLGWWRPLLGLILFAVMLGAHGVIFGVSPLPAGIH
ncbi:MAG: NnrU family protein [Rhodovibrionaceae bacterium]